MQMVVQEINQEYQTELDSIKSSVTYDTLEMSGSMAVWPEVLSVYSVKVTSDPDNPQEVATITDEKEQILRDIFWEMNTITHSTTTEEVTVIIETDDGNGNILEEEVTETRTTLHITVTHKSAEDMASQYNFNDDQNEHLPDPVASIVTAAADEAVKFAGAGAAGGSLFGGLTGATNEIDPTGRTSAVIGFATATVGLILSVIGLVVAIPSGGSSSIGVAAGVKLVVAGVSVLAGTAGTVAAGRNAVKTFQATDGADIDWDNIDWQKVGASSAQKAIENAADGYMWGSIIGVIHGGAEGYDFYHKYNTPYTQYNKRLMQTPLEGSKGKWTGERGESDFVLDEPIELPDGTKVTRVTYRNAVPDFSPYQKAQVTIPSMTNSRSHNFNQADKALAEIWTRNQHNGRSWTARQVEEYRTSNNLTWHEMSNMESMQLVPRDVNQVFTHFGGVAEYNAMIGQEGVTEFD